MCQKCGVVAVQKLWRKYRNCVVNSFRLRVTRSTGSAIARLLVVRDLNSPKSRLSCEQSVDQSKRGNGARRARSVDSYHRLRATQIAKAYLERKVTDLTRWSRAFGK